MDKVKLSTLSKDDVVLVDGSNTVVRVQDIINDFNSYTNTEIYTTRVIDACFNAKSILDNAIEEQLCNGMYEDWDDSIQGDITQEDIIELQAIFDRILARNPQSNIAYVSDKLIEIDIFTDNEINTCRCCGVPIEGGQLHCQKCKDNIEIEQFEASASASNGL